MQWSTTSVQGGTVVIALLVSVLTCEFWIRFAAARSIADAPGQRRMHQQITPRGGGVAIAVVMIATLIWQLLVASSSQMVLGGMLAGIAFAALAGLLDDFGRIGTAGKLFFQIVASVCIASPWLHLGWPTIVFGIAATLTVLVLINFWNFMDGANGLAATQAALVALVLAYVAHLPEMRLLALALLAALLGFLPFNLPRARLFMGDVGSHVIGASLAGVLLWELVEDDLSLFQAFILISAVTMDAGMTLVRRMIRGRRFWLAHREHLYQMAIRKGLSHSQVCLAYAVWTGLAGMFALAMATWSISAQAGCAGFIAALAMLIQLSLRRRWLSRPQPSRIQS